MDENLAVNHATILQQVVDWARSEENLRAAVLTGSVARGDGEFDELSDLDIELYVNDPTALLDHTAWYEQFGEVLVVEALENRGWHPTRLVYYADSKIDFMIAATSALAAGVLYDRPFRVLLDKDSIEPRFGRRPPGHAAPPTANEFLGCIQGFYAAIIMWTKYLIRDDPWSAKVRDWDSKRFLLQMVEWDSKARSGWTVDTWRCGAHLRGWAAPDVVSQMDACWSGLSRDGSAHSIRMSISLFEALSSRTARALGMERFDSSRILWRVHELLVRVPSTKRPSENA